MLTKQQIVDQIKEAAKSSGMAEADVAAFAEKCYDTIPVWHPFGGATSFEQIDQQKAVREYSYSVDDQTNALRGIIENITSSNDFSVDQKAKAIADAAAEYKTRVNAIVVPPVSSVKESEETSLIDKLKSLITGKKPVVVEPFAPPTVGGFKVYKDNEGNPRWLSLSSNAFEDREKELFTTAALEEAVTYADANEDRGPLRVFHVKGCDVGQCDFQAVVGRFLVESGTFDDTDLGRKALEYIEGSGEKFQVSIGFKYVMGDEADGQYDWLRITERSVLPEGTAANPWTRFDLLGEKEDMLHPIKVELLNKMFGEDKAKEIIANAESATKEMEESGTRFKELDTQTEFGEITEEVVETPAEEVKEAPVSLRHSHGDNLTHTHLIEAGKSHSHGEKSVVYTAEKAKAPPFTKKDEEEDDKKDEKKEDPILSAVEKMALAVADLAVTVGGIQTEVKALKEGGLTPEATWTLPGGIRPTESATNELSAAEKDKLEKIFSSVKEGESQNPAAPYVADLFPGRGMN